MTIVQNRCMTMFVFTLACQVNYSTCKQLHFDFCKDNYIPLPTFLITFLYSKEIIV
jgi:hypothetical protein